MKRTLWIAAAVASGIAHAQGTAAQPAPPSPPPAMQLAMRVVSPEVSPDHRIVFRILAPQAKTVGLRASDIQGLPREGRLAAESSPLTSAAAKNITHTTPRVASGTTGGMPPLVATKRNCLAMCRQIVTLCRLFPRHPWRV